MAFYSLFISFFYCYVATTRRCRGTFLFILWPATINKRRHCGTNDVAHPGTFPMEKRTHSLGMWWEVSATFRIFDWFGTNFNICVWARAHTLRVDGSTSLRKCYYCNDVFVLGQSNEIELGCRFLFHIQSKFGCAAALAGRRLANSTHAFSWDHSHNHLSSRINDRLQFSNSIAITLDYYLFISAHRSRSHTRHPKCIVRDVRLMLIKKRQRTRKKPFGFAIKWLGSAVSHFFLSLWVEDYQPWRMMNTITTRFTTDT